MNRRLLLGGAGLAAVVAGAGWRLRHEGVADTGYSGAPWGARFEQPDGGTLVLARLRGQPLVLNFWATWCPPCIREMPELDRIATDFAAAGVRVVGLAVDRAAPVKAYLAKHPVSYAVALAGLDGIELTRTLGNASGALPFTVVFDRSGVPVQRKLGETHYAELAKWVREL